MGKGQLREQYAQHPFRPPEKTFHQPSERPARPLSNRAHGMAMNRNQLRSLLTSLLGISAIVTWAFVIWAALQVSTVVLKTLEQIVNLAALG